MKYAVIFDLDGVLIDSIGMLWQVWREEFKLYGPKLSKKEFSRYIGMSLRDALIDRNKKYGLNIDLQSFSKESWEMQLKLIKKLKPDKKLIGFLKELKSHNIPLGIGTNSPMFRTEKILDILKIKKYFSAIVTVSHIERHKPHPDIFLETARKLKVKPENCIVFEDAPNGIEAAKRGKMKSIGRLTKHNTKKELKNADLIIKDFSEVSYSVLEKLINS
jgi:HAD superfamily hydrolase (TIGR01509 family)